MLKDAPDFMHTRGTLIWPILNNARLLDQIKPIRKKGQSPPITNPRSSSITPSNSSILPPSITRIFRSPLQSAHPHNRGKKRKRKGKIKKGKKKKKSREPLSSASPRKIPVSPDNSGDLSPSPPPAGVEEKTSSPARSAPLFHSNEMMRR